MATCARNHVATNLYTRMKKYLKLTRGIQGAEAYKKLCFVFTEEEYTGVDADVILLRSFFRTSPSASAIEKDITVDFFLGGSVKVRVLLER